MRKKTNRKVRAGRRKVPAKLSLVTLRNFAYFAVYFLSLSRLRLWTFDFRLWIFNHARTI